MIVSKKLSKLKEISHGFFDNKGGCSKGIYSSLNCGLGSNDDKKKVIKNLRIVKNKINRNSKNIFLLHQIHSNKFIFINKYSKYLKKKKADAVITDIPKLPIAVLTADCAPVLIYDKQKKMIAAIHVGWKGAYKGIILKVINFMIKKGCEKKNIIAVIGPCIAQKSYNVKEDFKKKFIKKDKKNKVFFKKRKSLIHFDLSKYIELQLKLMEITNLDRINIDTFPKKNNFFSARRSLHLNHDDYGRNISLIMIN